MSAPNIPEATVARLPVYWRVLVQLDEQGSDTVSSEQLAELAGVNAAKVRKDLSHLGSYGTRGVGYDVRYLLHEIGDELGVERIWPVVIAGAGTLGSALANFRGFADRGFPVLGLIDNDPKKVGTTIHGIQVHPGSDLDALVAESRGCIGVIATPASAAQDVADRMVAAGIKSILNFAPAVIHVPADVNLRQVDLSSEMQVLTFYAGHRDPGLRHGAGPGHTDADPDRRTPSAG